MMRFSILHFSLILQIVVLLCSSISWAAPKRLGFKDVWQKARKEIQVYRGGILERLGDWKAIGRSNFNKDLSVKANLKALADEHHIPNFYADINGRKVLHLVVELDKGKQTNRSLRHVFKRVGAQTIELNFVGVTSRNSFGHVAVRLGKGALYDLTGTNGIAQLPKAAEWLLNLVRGRSQLVFPRKRNLRRFMESRKDNPKRDPDVYYGMLFSASPEQIKETTKIYNTRIRQTKVFSPGGGDGSKGEYSCAQFLTENVPFVNGVGMPCAIGAKSTASAARISKSLESIIIYKTPRVHDDKLKNFP